MTALSLLLGLLLDWRLAEPRRYHPLVGFGHWANVWQSMLNRPFTAYPTRMLGLLAWCLAVGPWVLLAYGLHHWLASWPVLQAIAAGIGLYLAIGWQSLLAHAKAIALPLSHGKLPEARQALAMIVSRDTHSLNEQQIASAACESVLENGSDAIFAALFWFALAGLPGVVLYRLANTLDAMWGYKNDRFLHFGWAAARLDDGLNYLPARLCALSYVLMAPSQNRLLAWRCWREQGRHWKSPNAGPVMASGAGALGIALGGAACYQGKWQQRPLLGLANKPANAASIRQAYELVNRTLGLWALLLIVLLVSKAALV